jgi:hypothetical protein
MERIERHQRTMMRQRVAIFWAVGLGLAAVLGSARPTGAQEQTHARGHLAAPEATGTPATYGFRQPGGGMKLDVASLNNSGITGTVTLRDAGGNKLEVEVLLDGAGPGPLPIHIHEGACAELNPIPDIPLTTVTNGASRTELDGALQQLTAAPYAIFLHKSPQELPVFVACADIALADQLAKVPAAGEPGSLVDVATGLSVFGTALVATGFALRGRARTLLRRRAG